MRLSDRDIIQSLKNKDIAISPMPDLSKIEGVSVDLHLGSEFRVFNGYQIPYVDLAAAPQLLASQIEKTMSEPVRLTPEQRLIIHPGELVLGMTAESISIGRQLVAWLDGRSSLARLGLMVHVTSHRIDPGWEGNIVLEFFNSGKIPLALAPGMKICAINFETLSSPVDHPYTQRQHSKYKNQREVLGSRLNADTIES